jgi:lysophospholipase L1-like esterase
MALFDTRQTFGANWSVGIQTSGGNNIINTTLDSVQPRTFTPVNPFDTIELIYLANAIYGQAVLSVDGGVTPLGAVINQATGGSIRVKTTRTVPRGNYTVDFRRSGTGAASINAVCIRTYDSTQRSVDILNVSRGGTTTLLESENSAYYHPLSVNADSNMYAPDLVIICLDINNWINNYAAGTYDLATTTTHSFQLQKMIDAFRPTADVILMTGAPSAAARATLAIQAGITRATRVIAAANNVPLIDINAAFGSYLAAQSAYYTTADDAHPSALGYAAMADIVAASPELIF